VTSPHRRDRPTLREISSGKKAVDNRYDLNRIPPSIPAKNCGIYYSVSVPKHTAGIQYNTYIYDLPVTMSKDISLPNVIIHNLRLTQKFPKSRVIKGEGAYTIGTTCMEFVCRRGILDGTSILHWYLD